MTTYIASISGGKDSAAMSLWLTERGIEHRRVFADTGWEHPATYEYLRGPLQAKLGPIDWVRGPAGFRELILSKKMFPTFNHRFCTTKLKVEPIALYVAKWQRVIECLGIRAGESRARAKLTERECTVPVFGDRPDREHRYIWRPLLRWSEQDVIDIHRRHGLVPNPLYLQGATRVGCWPCFEANKRQIRMVASDKQRIDEIRQMEHQLGCTMFKGRGGPVPIDEVVAWSRTSHGGRQVELFSDAEPGCVRWGLCQA